MVVFPECLRIKLAESMGAFAHGFDKQSRAEGQTGRGLRSGFLLRNPPIHLASVTTTALRHGFQETPAILTELLRRFKGVDATKKWIADIVEIVGLKVSNSSAKTQKENAVAPRLTLSLPTLLLCEAGQEH